MMRNSNKKSFLKVLVPTVAALVLMIPLGCNLGSSSSSSSGNLSGTYAGNACGRNLEMRINQDGTNLTGTYTLSDPEFSESFTGTVASATDRPTSASLKAGADRTFELTFPNNGELNGTFRKSGRVVCEVRAVK